MLMSLCITVIVIFYVTEQFFLKQCQLILFTNKKTKQANFALCIIFKLSLQSASFWVFLIMWLGLVTTLNVHQNILSILSPAEDMLTEKSN
jgi:hypothetical protein